MNTIDLSLQKQNSRLINCISKFFILLTVSLSSAYSQQSYTFTNASATGSLGPTQTQINAAYLATNLAGSVVCPSGIQTWTVPITGGYRIEARGAQGFGAFGGRGARMAGDFTLTAGTVLKILVGQRGASPVSPGTNQYGGGGGSFVTNLTNSPYVVAGGGGGSWATVFTAASDGTIVTTGNSGANGPTNGAGGVLGGGGASAGSADGGGGLTGNGAGATTAFAFVNGGVGGSQYGHGGFGGGGGASSFNNRRGCGGGGYSGGGGAGSTTTGSPEGGGGGSFNIGANQLNSSGFNLGDGRVIITALCNIVVTNASTTGSGPICTGNSATLTTNAVSNYSWSNNSSAASIIVSPTITTSYTLTATSPSNCTASSVITVTVQNIVPTLTVASSSNSLCAGQSFVLNAIGADTYTWSGGATNGAAFFPTNTSGYTVTGANACGSSTASVNTITLNPSPTVTASVNSPSVCNGNTIVLSGGGNGTIFNWSGGFQNNVPFVPNASTVYTLVGTAANGCTASAVTAVTVVVTPNVPPVVTPTSVCLGTNATLTAIGASGYTWTPGTALNSFSAVVSPTGTTTYTLFRSNGACTSTANITLVINPLPFANATASPSLICAGDPVALNVIGGITYTWLPNGFTSANFTLFPNSSVSYTVASSNGSCTANGVVQVSVNPSPVVGISTSTSVVCAGGTVTLTATGNAATYTWLPGPGNGMTYTVNPTVISQYTLLGSNNVNCTTQQTQLILTNLVPPLVLNSSVPFVCTGTTAVLSIANATVPGVTYSWSSNSGSGSTSNVTPTVTTTYFASAVTNSTGCSSSGSLALTVNISTFVVSSPTAICRGNSAVISASGAANSYSWSVGGGNNATSVTVSPTLTTNYFVTGITGLCTSTQTVPLIVNPLPNVQASAAKSTICRLEFGTLTATGATSYSWSNGATTPAISYNTLTITTTYTVTGTDQNNCVKSNTVTQFVATCIGLKDLDKGELQGLSIYPNPNQGNVTIVSETDIKINILNALGQLVGSYEVSKDKRNELSFEALPNGIYFIVGENNGRKVNTKIVVDR